MLIDKSGAASKIDRYRVHPGEPGRNIITPFKDGYPIIEKPLALVSPPASSVTSLIEQAEGAVTSLDNEKANFRYALVNLLNQEEAKKDRPKGEVIDNLLELYNRGILLPNVYKKLGSVSRPTLYRFQKSFNKGGIDGLAPKKGQKGTSKITDHEKNFLLAILLHQNRIGKAYAITLTKEILKRKGLESPSGERTLRRFADQFEKDHFDLWVLHREGEKALNDKVLPYLERDWRLIEVGECVVADGHRLNFQIINPYTGKPCRAMLVMFWDWRSSYPLGWEIMLEESTQCVASALRNAIITLGKIPKSVYIDNGKAFKAKLFTEDISLEDTDLPGMFVRLGINYHFAQPYNAQSKPIERIFEILNEQLERLIPSYTGASIDDKPAWTKRNEKLARSAHNPWTPTFHEANDLISVWRDRYAERASRGRDNLRPIDIFNEGKGPGVDPPTLTYLMMEREIKHVHRNGIDIFGCHWYHEALYGLKDKVVIRYSLSDLSQIYVFYKNEYLCAAKPVEKVHPMASESENPKDMEAVKRGLSQKRSLKKQTVKIYHLLGKKQEQLPWLDIVNEVPDIGEAIEKIEADKKPETKLISPFVDGVTYSKEYGFEKPQFISPFWDEQSAPPSQQSPETEETESGRPRAFDADYEKMDWLLAHLDQVTDLDRVWMEDYLSRTSLYRDREKEIEEILNKGGPAEDSKEITKFKPPRDWDDFRGDSWERYDYLMAQNPATLTQKDLEFIDWFKSTSEYRSNYEVKPGKILSGG